MSDRGVSIQFVLDFCQGSNLWEKTTGWICYNIIKPVCETSGQDGKPCRYVELPHMVDKGIVGPAKTFVSHAWGAPFGLIVAALLEGEPDMNRFVWIDIFAVLQFDPKPADEIRFDKVIPHCSSFMLVVPFVKEIDEMDEYKAFQHDMRLLPDDVFKELPMFRVWCLVEIFAALKQLNIVFVMKVGMLVRNDTCIGGWGLKMGSNVDFLDRLSKMVDVSKARASVEEDRVRILMEHRFELEEVNAKVRGLCDAAWWGWADASIVLPLVSCAAMGDSGALSRLKQETSAEQRQAYQRVCAGRGFTTLLRDLLDTYPAKDRDEDLLVTAAQGGQVHCVRLLIQEYKFDVNAFDKYNKTACINAAAGGHTECLRLLIESGADINAGDMNGPSALTLAMAGNRKECVTLLLQTNQKQGRCCYCKGCCCGCVGVCLFSCCPSTMLNIMGV